jgi:hypothetical protein
MDWTKILKQGGVPEPPGYRETVARVRAMPKREKKKAKGKKKR